MKKRTAVVGRSHREQDGWGWICFFIAKDQSEGFFFSWSMRNIWHLPTEHNIYSRSVLKRQVHQKFVFWVSNRVTPLSAWKVAVCFLHNNSSSSGQLEFMSLSKGIPAVTFFHSRRKLSKRRRIRSSCSEIHTVCWAVTTLLRGNQRTNSTQLKWRK